MLPPNIWLRVLRENVVLRMIGLVPIWNVLKTALLSLEYNMPIPEKSPCSDSSMSGLIQNQTFLNITYA